MIKKSPFGNPFPNQETQNDPQLKSPPQNYNKNPQNTEFLRPPPKLNEINSYKQNNLQFNDFEQPQNNNNSNIHNFQPQRKYSNPYQKQSNDSSDFEIILNEYENKLKIYNCSNEFISPTTYIFPKNNSLITEMSFPLGLNISPFSNNITQIPIINYEEKNIPRCPNENCRAYLNPFVKFIDNGNKWICNICNQVNLTEDYYYGDLDQNNERVDRNTKVELSNGSYEFIANKQYWKNGKNPTKAFFMFLIETSLSSINNGYLNAIIESIKDIINNESFYNGNDINLSFITYDTNVHFYSYNNKMNQPQMLCVADEPVFLPSIKDNLIFNLKDHKDKILQILDLIQNTFITIQLKILIKYFLL